MAESHAGFDSIATLNVDDIREKLRRTMVMGLPNVEADRPTFFFQRDMVWADHDREENPWVWTDAPISDTTQATIQPICAYEFYSPLGRQGSFITEVGEFNPTTVVFSLFEDEYEAVQGFSYATIGPMDPEGNYRKWFFRYWRPASGLDGLTLYQIHCAAEGTE